MFKIHENGDGTTSIFCNQTGKLICTIRNQQQKNMGLGCRPLNVVESSPRPRSCCYNLDLKSECGSDVKCSSSVEEQNTRDKICASSDEPKEDFFDDCVTEDEFARCLNLVPKEKLKNESQEQLKSSFPLRHISRTKKSLLHSDVCDVKYDDHIPLFSKLGIQLLKLNKQKNFYSEQTIDMKIKHYESFCRVQLNTLSECSNFPKLRCRERRDYPICNTQKVLRYTPTHMYAFNRRQRLEKLITFRTGLNTHSRRLLQKCNKRLAVSIKGLTAEEIDKWPHNVSRIGPISANDIKDEEPSSSSSYSITTVIEPVSPIYIDVELFSSDSEESSDSDDPSVIYPLKGVLNSTKTHLKKGECYTKFLNKPVKYGSCCVKLNNVLNRIQKRFGNYYVTGTDIHIPFYKDFLNSSDQKVLSGIVIPGTNHSKNSRSDHAYHRPFSKEAYKKEFLNSKCLIHKTPTKIKDLSKQKNCIKSKSSLNAKNNCIKDSNLKSTVNKTVSRIEDIPVIDLTDESSPNWRFHCYGCGYKRVSMEESVAYSSAALHMRNFHCVSDVKAFLNESNTQSGVVLEAFPGYKQWS